MVRSSEDIKEYNRQRAARLYVEYLERREALFAKLGGECYLCEGKAVKGFNLHHVDYHEVESNYPRNSRSMSVRIKRLTEAENNPERFKLLCPRCHLGISKVHDALQNVNWDKFAELMRVPENL